MMIIQYLPVIAAAFFAAMVASLEIGFRYGLRRSAKHPEEGDEGTGTIEAAVFALFGLILAFSFSGAMSRLDDRRAMIVQEVNAIGTAYLRIDLLPEADQPALRELFRKYVDSRIAVFEDNTTFEGVLAEIDRGTAIQNEIWAKAVASVNSDNTMLPPRTLVIPALNDMIDITTTRKVAMFTHLPDLILWLLIAISLISALLAGYAMSKRRKGVRSWFHALLYAVVVSLTMYIVLDLEFPRAGLIRLHEIDRAMLELRDSMK
jgi:hypothetical protein